jgi:hypothetical protein
MHRRRSLRGYVFELGKDASYEPNQLMFFTWNDNLSIGKGLEGIIAL